MRRVVFGDDGLGRLGERLVGVAFVAHHLARLARGFLQLRLVGGRIITCVRPVIPLDGQRLASLDRRPGVAGNHRDTADRLEFRWWWRPLDDHDLLHAWHLHRRGAVIRREFPAHYWRPRYDGVFQSGELGVDAIDRASGGDVEEIDDRDIPLAEIPEGSFVLELDLVGGRCRQRTRGSCELAIAEFASRGPVNNLVVLRLNLGDSYSPALCRGGFQHLPHGGAALTHRLDEVAHTARAVGVLVAVFFFVAG